MRVLRCINCHYGMYIKEDINYERCPRCKSISINVYENSSPTPDNLEELNGRINKKREVNKKMEEKQQNEKQKEENIVTGFKSGKDVKSIAGEMSISTRVVRRILRKHSLSSRKNKEK